LIVQNRARLRLLGHHRRRSLPFKVAVEPHDGGGKRGPPLVGAAVAGELNQMSSPLPFVVKGSVLVG
jgi:hypothetical protein